MKFNYYSFLGFVIAAFLLIGMGNIASAQIKIGTNGSTIAPSSILELESNNQGLLLPRLTDTTAINTLNPPNGMLIYLTKWPAVGLYVRKTTGWEFLTGSLGGNGTFNDLTVGGTLIAQNFSGNLIGNASTATLATTATNAVNVNITNDLSTSTVTYPTFVTNTPGSTSMRTSSTKLSFVPNTGILTAIGFKGNLVGNVTGVATSSIDAVNASNTDVEDDVVSNSIQYPTFVTATNGNLPQKTSSTNLTYIPLTGELKALKFNGPLQGNASSATLAEDAVNSQNSRITDDMVSSAVSYPVFVNSIFGNQPIKSSSSNLTYVPSTGILTAKGFVGNLTGDVTGTVSKAKDADNAAKIQVVENSISTSPFYPTFVSGTVGPLSATINSSKLKYIPATGEFFSPIFKGELIGNASTTTTATNAANVAVTDDSANPLPTYPVFVNAITGNQAIKSSSSNLSYLPSTGILTAKGFVGNLVGDVTGRVSNAQDADNAAKIQIAEDAISNLPVYPTFVTGTVGPLTATINSSKLKYIPSAGELIAPVFKGELVGNASTTTTATNAANVLITDDISNSLPTYPVFVNAINGNQAVKSSSSNLSYVPSTGILTAKGFVGNLVGDVTGEVSNALNAVNAANINVSADDISAGTVYPVFVSAITGALQPKVSTNFLGFKPLTGELTAPTFRGEFMGNATTATSATTATNSVNSAITDDNSNTGTFFPVFVGTASGNQAIKTSSNNLKYVPSTGILSATGFAGPLVGNVTGQATSALSAVSATNATTADNALKSEIIDDASHSAETYPLFVNNAAGNQPLRSNGVNLKYIPSTGTLKAKEFEGNFNGNLNGIASNALESTNSANVAITDDLTSNFFMPLTFVNGNSGNLPVKVSSSELTFNPSIRELKSDFFRGDLLGNANTATTISPTGLVLPVNGGTGLASYAPGDILYAESANTLKKLPIGPFGAVLRVAQPAGAGTALLPSWATTGPGTITEVQYGGTGSSSFPSGSILIGNGTNAINPLVPAQAGKVLTSNGPGLAPSFENAGVGDMINIVDEDIVGIKTFGVPGVIGTPGQTGKLALAGYTSGRTYLNGPDIGGGTVTLPQSGTLVTLLGTEVLTNKTLTSPMLTNPSIGDATGATLKLGGGTPLTTTNQTGTGSIVMSNNAQLTAPNIGNATGASLSVGGGTITAGSFVGNLTGNISGNADNVSGIVQITNGGTGANSKQTGFDNLSPMNSPGDMIYGETLGSARRLALGGANQVLKGGVTAPQWGSVNLSSDVLEVLPAQNGGTGNAFTEFTGPFITKKVFTLPNADAVLARTDAGQTFTGTQIFTSTIDGNISTATTATKLAATKNINGVPFDGSADINIPAASLSTEYIDWNATSGGAFIKNKPIINSGTVTSVTAPIPGTTGTDISLTVANTSTTPVITLNVPTASATNRGALSSADWTTFNAKQAALSFSTGLTNSGGTVTVNSTQNIANLSNLSTNGIVTASGGTGALSVTPTNGSGNVVLTNSPTLVTPNIGTANGTSLSLTGSLTSTVTTGTAPFVVSSITPVSNLNIGGNAASATKLAIARTINGEPFDGTSNISVPSASLSTEYIDWNATSGGAFIKNKPNIVTSVGATVPPFLTVTGSPITNSGVLAINYNSGVGLPVANGGTGLTSLNNGGALYATSATTLTSGTLPVTAGGTGQTNFAVGDILYASTASALAKLPSVAAGNALISNGVGVAPTWGKIDLATHILGTIPVSLGGTGSSTQNFVDLTMPQSIAGIKTFTSKIVGDISGNADGNAATATKFAATKTVYGNAFDGTANLDQIIAPAFGGTGNRFTEFVGPTGTIKKFTLPDNDAVLARTDAAQTFNGVQTFLSTITGSISGNAATATIASGLNPSTTLTSPNLITPLLGTASATSINKVIITPPAVSATLSLADGSALATSGANSITLTSTGSTNVTLPTSGILVSAITASGTLDFVSVNPGLSDTQTITVTGAADGDAVSLGVPNALASAGGIYTAWVSAPNTVTVKFSNTTAVAINPDSAIFKIKVLK